MTTDQMMVRYAGRAGGAYAAYAILGKRAPGGALGLAVVVALGWLAGGYVTDRIVGA